MRAAMVFCLSLGLLGADEKKEEKKPALKPLKIGSISYSAPEDWTTQKPSSAMRIAQVGLPLAEGDKGKAEIIVFYAPNGMGDNASNIKRWKGMFAKTDAGTEESTFETDAKLKVTLVDITGTYNDKPPMANSGVERPDFRMVGAIVESPDDAPYYFRLIGPKKSIAAQVEAFKKMLKSGKPGAKE
jgi:hypothetical protein